MTTPACLRTTATLLLLSLLAPALAQAPAALPTVAYTYTEGFEGTTDPVEFWTSYNKPYTVNFKGLTTDRAHSGKQCFKLDVTFKEASRFLWRIPLDKQPAAEGALAFSGWMLLGPETTGTATLGVSLRFPPTIHNGCTRPYDFYTTTQGDWLTVGDDFVARSEQIAGSVMGTFEPGVAASNVGRYLEALIIDLRGQAGQRVVLYVDDLQVTGEVPAEAAYAAEVARRWAPVAAAVAAQRAAWEQQLARGQQALAALAGLSPRAEALRGDLVKSAQAVRAALDAAAREPSPQAATQAEIERGLARLSQAGALRALSAAERDGRPAVLYATPPISAAMVLPGDLLAGSGPATEVAVTAARDEYEPASLLVAALTDLKGLTVQVSDLRSPAATIARAAVDVRSVKCWYQAGTAWVSIRQDKSRKVLTPELLLYDDSLVRVDEQAQRNYVKLHFPDGNREEWIDDPTDVVATRHTPVEDFPVRDSRVLLPLDLAAGRTKQFWLTVHVPGEAVPGTYTGTVTFRSTQGPVGEVTLKLRVLPFTLLPPYYTSSMDYHGRPSDHGTISSWVKSREQFRAELQNMVAHGLHNCQHYSIPRELLGEVLRTRAEVGMDNRVLYLKNTIPIGSPTDPAALEAIKHNVRDILEFVKPFGTETVYFYGIDELEGEKLAAQRAAWQAVREAGGRIFVAGGGDNVEMMADIQDMHVRAGWPKAEEVARWHALGHKIFSYANPQTGVENPVVYRRNFGLLLWKYDYDGAATNAYQQTFGAVWNDFDHPTYRAHTIAYPTVDGVVDTIAWEGYREGVDDVRYVTTLQQAIETARQSGDAARERRAGAAARFLRELKGSNRIETGDLDALRGEIIALIESLTAAAPR